MIRRHKTTIFTDAKESSTVFELKRIVEGILKRPPDEQRLYKVRPRRFQAGGGRARAGAGAGGGRCPEPPSRVWPWAHGGRVIDVNSGELPRIGTVVPTRGDEAPIALATREVSTKGGFKVARQALC